MKIDITYDQLYMVCTSDFPYELQLLKRFLTREVENAYMFKKKLPFLSTERTFINEYGMVPIGLWLEILRFGKKYNIYIEMTQGMQSYLGQFQLDYNYFLNYVNKTFKDAKQPILDDKGNPTGKYKPFIPREYQIKAAYTLLKYRKACGEISTSSGKTLITFIIFKFLIDSGYANNILYIVPSVDLAIQSAEKYELYETYLKKHNHNWEIGILKSGLNKKEKEKIDNCNILFGTYQSLCKKDNTFFSKFTACISDETHHSQNNSEKNILSKSTNLKYTIGVTGTFPKPDTIGNLTIQSYIGPVMYYLTAEQLINDEKAATPTYVVFEILDWATYDEKQMLYYQRNTKSLEENKNDMQLGTKLLKQEQEFINNSYIRLKYISDMAIKMAKNTLILFGDVKGEYGKKITEYIKNNSTKNAYYIDGTTPTKIRDYYKECMANDNNGKTIIVGSINTMGEGIDITNIESIFLVNTAKSDRIVRQIVGRGLRLGDGKEKCIIYDFIDDLRFSNDPKKRYYDNYMWKHYLERKKIYHEQKFPTFEQKIKFNYN